MPDTDMGVASKVAERIRRRIAGEAFPIDRASRLIDITISIGLAGRIDAGDNATMLLKRADDALYRAKRSGRNRVVSDAA